MFQYSHELSAWLAAKYSFLFEPNKCYENVFHLLSEVIEFQATDMQVLFCYVPTQVGLHYRHAFGVYKGKIVEPLLHLNLQGQDLLGVVPIKLMDTREYFKLVVEDGCYDMFRVLHLEDINAFNKSKINLHPSDLSQLILGVATTQQNYIQLLRDAMGGKGIPLIGGNINGKRNSHAGADRQTP